MLRSLLISTVKVEQQQISILCQRISSLYVTKSFYSTAVQYPKQKKVDVQKLGEEFQRDLSPAELLRKEALKIEVESSLRPRCLWLKEEDEKLLRLVNEHGKRWTFISKHFIDRPPSTLMNRYSLLNDTKGRGPWTPEEIEILRKLGRNRRPEDIDNWEEIQKSLPSQRPMFLIKQKYGFSLNPATKFGRWSDEESSKLESLINKYGENNLDKVATLMGSRTKRQCLERWRWQIASKRKGRFSPEEDRQIVDAVKKYGTNFAVIAKVINSERTARHISQHYRNMLAPDIDRSPWTYEEQIKVYQTCLKNDGNMMKTKRELGTNRAIRDLWNHFHTQKKHVATLNENKTIKQEELE